MTKEELIEKFKELHIYPVIQHPDYENNIVYDIDDILELVNSIKTD